MVRRFQRGLSLIEVMVALAILMIVTLIAVPLTGGWVKGTHRNHAIDVLREGYATVRAVALQNPSNSVGANTVAATLTVSGSSITVTFPSTPNPTTVWTGTVDADTTISLNRTDTTCTNTLTLNNQGMPINADCLDYALSVTGLNNETGTL